MSNLAPPPPVPTTLHAWLLKLMKDKHAVRLGLSNGTTREGRLMGHLDDFVMLAPVPPARQPIGVATAHIVTVDIIEAQK